MMEIPNLVQISPNFCIDRCEHLKYFPSALPVEVLPQVRQLIAALIQSCLKLSKVVSPVVQNSSPEGNVPEDAILGLLCVISIILLLSGYL